VSRSSESYLTIVSQAIAAGGASVTDNSVRMLLVGSVFGPAAVIAAPALAEAVKTIIEQLAKQDSEIEEKINGIISEPSAFARQTLIDNLSI